MDDPQDLAARRFGIFFEYANDTVVVLDTSGTIVEVNTLWEQVFGLTAAEAVGRNISEFATPSDVTQQANDFTNLVNGEGAARKAVQVQTPSGKKLYMDFSAKRVNVHGQDFIFAIGRDVTAHLQAVNALAEAEEKYRNFIERIPGVIWSGSIRTGSITFVTASVERIWGFTAEEVVKGGRMLWFSRIHPDDRNRVAQIQAAIAHSNASFDLECQFQRKDGQWIWIRNRSIANYERNGERFIDGMFSEITEERRMEERLRQAQKLEAVGRLTGGIAHDFNNIMAAILANTHFLIEGLPEGNELRTDALEIKKAAERAANLTRQLTAFSRKQVLTSKELDLNRVVSSVDQMVRTVVGDHITVSFSPGAALGMIRADASQIEQMIMNMALNSRDAMPSGGKFSIETANVDIDENYASSHNLTKPGRYVMLTITDTGCGMDATVQRRIFEPFFTTKDVGKGNGLGLSTCYGIVQQSGGSIWVKSEVGVGTVFKIYLPRTDAVSDVIDSGAEKKKSILLVEDHDQVRKAARKVLESRGYQVHSAASMEEALAICANADIEIDMILSDVVMPEGSGPDLFQQARVSRPALRVLFMSGYADYARFGTGLVDSATNFIQKPFVPSDLAKKVREVLEA